MGRKGWRGAPPAHDTEARRRIIGAAVESIDQRGARHTNLSNVASDLGISRPTIYRHFGSTEELLAAAAETALAGWTARIGELTRDIDDPVELLTEACAYLIERLPDEPLLAMLLETDRMRLISRQMVMPDAVSRSRTMLEHTHIRWAEIGFSGSRFDDFVEFLLRMIQSMVIAPSDPPRSAAELRGYLRQLIGSVVAGAAAPVGVRSRARRTRPARRAIR